MQFPPHVLFRGFVIRDQITVMYFYTPEAMEYLGNISVAQMASFLTDGLVTTNEAMTNSGINAEFALVYVGMVRRSQGE